MAPRSSWKNLWLKIKATPLISSTLASAVVLRLMKFAVMAMASFPRNSFLRNPYGQTAKLSSNDEHKKRKWSGILCSETKKKKKKRQNWGTVISTIDCEMQLNEQEINFIIQSQKIKCSRLNQLKILWLSVVTYKPSVRLTSNVTTNMFRRFCLIWHFKLEDVIIGNRNKDHYVLQICNYRWLTP